MIKCPTCGTLTEEENIQNFNNDRAADQAAFRMVQTAMMGCKEKLDYVTEQYKRSEIERARLTQENAQLLKSLSQAIQIARKYQDELTERGV
jgi:septal ring factor EnvC (AmiA/AmiB activator)